LVGGDLKADIEAELDWISADDDREGLSDGKAECAPAMRKRTDDDYRERVGMAALEFRLAERLGGTAKPGWSPRKGRRLSPFLGAVCVAIGPIRSFVSPVGREV